ncbi:hypothetical protein CEXT_439201 [Caerostris extrusa]|uniref:Uncharacterized protein n=1 Tax=Caerostris extrusa TaxID=172846 RepID=A0AAV4N348_CAEEX|nr:hypothetical protein CEXT_439201 [Caerostris extrusa]
MNGEEISLLVQDPILTIPYPMQKNERIELRRITRDLAKAVIIPEQVMYFDQTRFVLTRTSTQLVHLYTCLTQTLCPFNHQHRRSKNTNSLSPSPMSEFYHRLPVHIKER